MKKNLFYIKLILLFVIFVWILKSVNLSETIRILKTTNLSLFFIAFLINNLSNIFLTIKWHRLSTPLNIKSSFLDLLRLNFISVFYSSFVPGQASGELIKGYKLSKKEGAQEKVWIPIFIDKITNLLITLIIGLVAILFDKNLSQNKSIIFCAAALTLACSVTTIILFSEHTEKITRNLTNIAVKILRLFKIQADSIKNFSLTYFEEYKKHDKLMFETLLWSAAIKLPHIFAYFFLAGSLNINLSVIQCAWLFSIISIVTILPVSFSGLGVREGSMIFLLSQAGIEKSLALGMSILIFLQLIMVALIGGVLELFYGHGDKNKK